MLYAWLLVLLMDTSGMVVVPSGWFWRGCNIGVDCPLSYVTDSPRVKTYVSTFYIDRYETSAEEFAQFLTDQGEGEPYIHGQNTANYWLPQAAGVAPSWPTIERFSATQSDTTFYQPKLGYENYPANLISWYGADAYCRWRGKRLPTEAEWEKAARGTDFRLYPWGNDPPNDARARYLRDWSVSGMDTLSPVDGLPQGVAAYGALNMAGNVWDWVSDWYDAHYYLVAPDHDPQGPASPPAGVVYKGLRGGSAVSPSTIELTTPWRTPHEPWIHSSATGVRCARSAQ